MISPVVSIIVPTYNSRLTLRCALESIQRQEFSEFEVLVIGDACTDDSGEVVEQLHDGRFQWSNRAANSGSSSPGYREGLARARGKYVAYLGHDDLWFPWHLAVLVDVIEAERAALAHSLVAVLGPDDAVQIAGPPQQGASYRGHFVPPSGWLHERTIAIRAGGWRDAESLARSVDIDLLQRIAALGVPIACSPRLSVLKWPSAWWKAYAEDAPRPQIAVAAAMATDPRAVADRILNNAAVALSRRTWRDRARSVRGEWREAADHFTAGARLLVRSIVQPNGNPRWPFEPLLRWRFQRARRRMRGARGLKGTRT